jgi:two-component system alkaline phosphatase synthesis response regulator PhoP
MKTEPNILVVDDEVDILELVSFHLERAGFNVLKAKDGETALSIVWDENIDLVVLDLMLPGMNGLEVLKSIKENKRTENIPVILLTAKTTEVDRIVGFELGTDDYVCKPFSVKELTARVKALLRRSSDYGGENSFIVEGFSVNFTNHKIYVEQKLVDFSPKEFALLELLYRSRNAVISREQILDKVWGMDASVDDRVVDVNITRIREKMGKAKKIIRTVKGYGYIFDPDALDKD